MKIKKFSKKSGIAGLFALSLVAQAVAATIPFSNAPAGNAARPPAPNLILTLDNSGSMGTTGINALRAALTAAFSAENVPANSIRLGWNLFNADAAGVNCTGFNTASCGGNAIQVFDESRRTAFLNWVANPANSMNTPYTTPTHQSYLRALQQFNIPPTDPRSPWAEFPNDKVGNYLACRKSYVMLMTDGAYNTGYNTPIALSGSTNLDSIPRTLPDGTAYDPATNLQLNAYRDADTPGFNTISDLAFHYWATDLVTGSADNILKPTINVPGSNTYTSGGSSRSIEQYWNPRNNPATWQHVVTHTIGFNGAASWPARDARTVGGITIPRFDGRPVFPVDLNALLSGEVSWPRLYLENATVRGDTGNNVNQRKQTEMWHAAINSRGNFYPANTPADLVNAIRDIVQTVTKDNSQRITSAAGSSLSARVDNYAYYTSYDAETWSGDIGIQVNQGTGSATAPASPWGSDSTAASLLNANPSRNIWTSGVDGSTFSSYKFEWASLNSAQQATLNAGSLGAARVAYLRGDRSQEATGAMRIRKNVLGDIVNSNIWFMRGKPNAYSTIDYLSFAKSKESRPDMLFVGANDGMLHAFRASTGQEVFAYVPQGIYHQLSDYTSPTYTHRYFVDGSPFTADFKDGSNWKSMLVGFMGAGSKGYFMLDVTDLGDVASTSPVVSDTTATSDPDIGHIFQTPVTEPSNRMVTRQIARLNNNQWALVIGNGYNSTNEKAVLLIHYLTGPSRGTVKKIEATSTIGDGNGLSAPRLIDLNGDDVPDVVYAGDLKGNLWKFDIAGTNDSTWGLASTTPILRAKDASSVAQPITTAPITVAHPDDGIMLVVGTGKNLTDADRADTHVQTFYGVRDTLFTIDGHALGDVTITGAPAVANRSELVEQTFTTTPVSTDGSISYYTQSSNPVDYATKKGWYLDMGLSGERALDHPQVLEGTTVRLLGRIPASSPADANTATCDTSVSKTKYTSHFVDAVKGSRPEAPVFGSGPGDDANGYISDDPSIDLDNLGGNEVKPTCVGKDCQSPAAFQLKASSVATPSWRQME